MKTIKKALLVALMFGTLIGYANENTEPTNSVTGKRIKVEFKLAKKGHALTIKNESGITIYKQLIKRSGTFSKVFDLTYLEDGIYIAELEKDFEIIVKKIQLKSGKISYIEKENKKIFKPIIRKEGNLLLISKLTFNKQPLKVVLYYNNHEIVSETLKDKELINRVYKLSKTEKGAYKIVINTDDRVYVKDFTL
jgi:hypothetical protein